MTSSCINLSETVEETIKNLTKLYKHVTGQRYYYASEEVIIFPEGYKSTMPKIPMDSLCSLIYEFPLPKNLQFVFEKGTIDSTLIGCWISYQGLEVLNITKNDFYKVVNSLQHSDHKLFVQNIFEINFNDDLDSWILAKYSLSDLLGLPADSLDPILIADWKYILSKMRKSLVVKVAYSSWIKINFQIIYRPIPEITIGAILDTIRTSSLFNYFIIRKLTEPYEEELERMFPMVPDAKAYDNGQIVYYFISANTQHLVQFLEQMKDVFITNDWKVTNFLTLHTLGTLNAIKGNMKVVGSYDFTKGQVLTFTLKLRD